MNYMKKLGLVCVAIAFLMSLAVVSSYGQRYREQRRWENRDSYRQNNQNRRWRSDRYRSGRITPQEYRRLSRQRNRLYQRTNRYYSNDGYLSWRERRNLSRKYYQYRRAVRRDRRDW